MCVIIMSISRLLRNCVFCKTNFRDCKKFCCSIECNRDNSTELPFRFAVVIASTTFT